MRCSPSDLGMRMLLVLLVVLMWAVGGQGQAGYCSSFASCDVCAGVAGCGWCVPGGGSNVTSGSCLPGTRTGSYVGDELCQTGEFGFWSYTNGQACLAWVAPSFDIIPNIDYKRSPNCVIRDSWYSECHAVSFGIGFAIITVMSIVHALYICSSPPFSFNQRDYCGILVRASIFLAFAFALCASTNKSWTAVTGGNRDRFFSPVLISISGLGCWGIADGAPGRYSTQTSYCNLCHNSNNKFVHQVPWLRKAADYSGYDSVADMCAKVRACAGLSLTATALLTMLTFVSPLLIRTEPKLTANSYTVAAFFLGIILALIWPPVALWRDVHDAPYIQSYKDQASVSIGGAYRLYLGACVLVTFAFVLCVVKHCNVRFLVADFAGRAGSRRSGASRTDPPRANTILALNDHPAGHDMDVDSIVGQHPADADQFAALPEPGSEPLATHRPHRAPSYKLTASTSSLPPPYVLPGEHDLHRDSHYGFDGAGVSVGYAAGLGGADTVAAGDVAPPPFSESSVDGSGPWGDGVRGTAGDGRAAEGGRGESTA